jgi:uncharacterized protein YozE (UPF0346 family)
MSDETKAEAPPPGGGSAAGAWDMTKFGVVSFRTYARRRPPTSDPEGDIAADIRIDSDFPSRVRRWQAVEEYLSGRGAIEPAVRAARALWEEYDRWCQAQRPGL